MSTDTERHLPISPREREVVQQLAMGRSAAEIATQLGMKPNTVKNMLDTLRYKLGVRTRREIPMAYWRQTGDDPFPEADGSV